VVSIFVNPSQFNEAADLARYPRTVDADLALLESLGADEVLAPGVPEVYPNGYRFRIEPRAGDLILEGAHRPGFLQGVMTVVLKLLNLVRPDRAYFGEKDYQQLKIVAAMAEEFFLSTAIVSCPTVREESGLAMSSRNVLLSPEGRARASLLYRTIGAAATCSEAEELLARAGFGVEYVVERWGRRLAAVYLEGVRLIDNVPIAGV
jgi:pantoate--beta-alanine ligase